MCLSPAEVEDHKDSAIEWNSEEKIPSSSPRLSARQQEKIAESKGKAFFLIDCGT